MIAFRAVIAAAFGIVFVHAAACNCWIYVQGMLRKRPTPSPVPIVGGIAGVVAWLVQPWISARWCWVPLLADWDACRASSSR